MCQVEKAHLIVSKQLEVRFVLAQVLWLLPLLGGELVRFGEYRSPLLAWFAVRNLLLLTLIAAVGWRWAMKERREMETLAVETLRFPGRFTPSKSRHEFGLPVIAALFAGGIWSLGTHNARWLMVAIGAGILLIAGLWLKNLTYERWIRAQMQSLRSR